MIFYKEPTGLLNAYNNSIFEFGIGSKATITIEGYSFSISSINGRFYFNLKEIVKALINENEFEDTTSLSGLVTQDDSLYKEYQVNFNIDNTDFASRTLVYLKSAQYIEEGNQNNTLRPLLPSNNVTYFEGLPFDFSLYSNQNRNAYGLELSKGVNRIQLEASNCYFETGYFADGYFECEGVTAGAIEGMTFKKVCKPSGEYIKWFSRNGGWCYWQFEKYDLKKHNSKPLEDISKDTENLHTTRNYSSLGNETIRSIVLRTGLMDESEQLFFVDFISSPKRFIYRNEKWIEIGLKPTTATIDNTMVKQNFTAEIYLTDNYNQNL